MVFKEWIKVRWFLVLYLVLSLLATGYIFLRVRHGFTFNGAKNYWYMVLFQGLQWFRHLKYLLVAGGVLLAIAQYFPETVNKRIKLTFHLPVNENRSLLMMMLFGTVCLLICYLVVFLVFTGLAALFFAPEIAGTGILSVLPWFIAGFAAYYLGALVILEPVWLYRVLYLLAAFAFVPLCLKNSVPGGYAPAMPVLAMLVVLLSIALLFSGYRFRKGEM